MRRRLAGEFNVALVGKVGNLEAIFGVCLQAMAIYIAIMTRPLRKAELSGHSLSVCRRAQYGLKPAVPSSISW